VSAASDFAAAASVGETNLYLNKSGRLDTVRTFSGWRPGLGAWPAAAVA